jgi:hypothetical protein
MTYHRGRDVRIFMDLVVVLKYFVTYLRGRRCTYFYGFDPLDTYLSRGAVVDISLAFFFGSCYLSLEYLRFSEDIVF